MFPKNQVVITNKIFVKTYYGQTDKWIQFRRGDQYHGSFEADESIPDVDEDGFITVQKKKIIPKGQNLLYHWSLFSHNFYPFEEGKRSNLSLYFCRPDYQIYQSDRYPLYALDQDSQQIVPLITFARLNNFIKFRPVSFVAKNEEHIRDILSHVSYCVAQEIQSTDDIDTLESDEIYPGNILKIVK